MSNVEELLRARGLLLATHNRGKVSEFDRWLGPLGVRISSAADHDLPAPDETASDFIGNARLKARAARTATGIPSLADDSGLSVAGLDGAPGLHSARWAPGGNYEAAFARIAEELGGPGVMEGARAAFVCVLVLDTEAGEWTGQGRVEGSLLSAPRGKGGFGYDPIFVPDGETRTFAEMTPSEKAGHSHRARAMADLGRQTGLSFR